LAFFPNVANATDPLPDVKGDWMSQMLHEMVQLLQLIGLAASDRTTLDEIVVMVSDSASWINAHALFDRIRDKTLKAERSGNHRLEAQYLFEEVCAKTLYNLADVIDPFDEETPYWIVPNALVAAKRMGIDPSRVVAIVSE
jgi:hypothetical protein